MQSTYPLEKVLKMISLYVSALLCTLQHIVIRAMQLSCIACMTICCSVHKSALTHKEIIFGTFSNQYVLCICICLISCTESETYAHDGLRKGGQVFRAPSCIYMYLYICVCVLIYIYIYIYINTKVLWVGTTIICIWSLSFTFFTKYLVMSRSFSSQYRTSRWV